MDINFLIFASEDGGEIIQILVILLFIVFTVIGSAKGAKKAEEKRKGIIAKKDVSDRSFFYTKEEKARANQQKVFMNTGFEIIDDRKVSENKPVVMVQNQNPSEETEEEEYKSEDSSIEDEPVGNLESKHLKSSIKEQKVTQSENYEFSRTKEEIEENIEEEEYDSDDIEEESSKFIDDERIFSSNISDEHALKTKKQLIRIPKGNSDDLAQAVILSEIFGQPLSMRKPYDSGYEDKFESSNII